MVPGYRIGTKAGDGRAQHGRWPALTVALVMTLAIASVPAVAWAIPAGIARTQDTRNTQSTQDTAANTPIPGQVVAQGVARLPRGDVAWTIRRIDVPGDSGTAVESFPVGFALADAGTVAVLDQDGDALSVIAAGEAAFLPEGRGGALSSFRDDPASLYEIALVSGDDATAGQTPGALVGNPFAAPSGASFDIELARATLTGAAEVTMPVSRSGAPSLYVQTAGAARLAASGQTVELAAGQYALLSGEVLIGGANDEPATFVVAVIGEAAAERNAAADGTPRARADRAAAATDTQGAGRNRERRGPRVRTGGGGGGGSAGGGGGGQSQPQNPGDAPPITGGVEPTVPVGAPPPEPPLEATPPPDTTIPDDGIPAPDATPPAEEPAPTDPIPGAGTPPSEPTDPVEPTDPADPADPVDPVDPADPGDPVEPVEPTDPAESAPPEEEPATDPEETLPVEAIPVTETVPAA